jgi:stage V sporulation protein B
MWDKQTTSKGFFILSFAGIINKILALIYVPIQLHIVGNYGNGIIGAGYKIYIFIYCLSNAGIPAAISKMVSEQIALGKFTNCQKILKTAGSILLIFGIVSSLFLALGAHWISQKIYQPDAYFMIVALSPTFLFTSIASTLKGYFQGRSNMIPTGIAQIIEQALNSLLTIIFVALFIKYGVEMAAMGSTIGTSFGALGSASFLLIVYFKNRRKVF